MDDVFVIAIFTVLLGMHGGKDNNFLMALGEIPLSIVLGILSRVIPGHFLLRLFQRFDLRPP